MAGKCCRGEMVASEMPGSALYFYNPLDIFIWMACLGPNCRDLLNRGIKEAALLAHSAGFTGRETLVTLRSSRAHMAPASTQLL